MGLHLVLNSQLAGVNWPLVDYCPTLAQHNLHKRNHHHTVRGASCDDLPHELYFQKIGLLVLYSGSTFAGREELNNLTVSGIEQNAVPNLYPSKTVLQSSGP